MQARKRILRAAVLLLWAGLSADPASACSLVNVAASTAESVAASGYYWIVSGLVGGLLICIEFYQRRWSSMLSVVVVTMLVFHPRWTIAPVYRPDCVFLNVEASQYVLAAICLLLVYRIFRMVRSRGRKVS